MLDRLKKILPTNQRSVPSQNRPSSSDNSSRPQNKAQSGWIGVDLDGTLAECTKWKGLDHIGKPIPLMKKRVLEWIEAKYTVKIVTARASVPKGIPPVKAWLAKNDFPDLEVTNQKDFNMIELWDDRAIQVITNTGKPVIRPSLTSNPQSPFLIEEKANETFVRPESGKKTIKTN